MMWDLTASDYALIVVATMFFMKVFHNLYDMVKNWWQLERNQ
jgi:hypothetical protein